MSETLTPADPPKEPEPSGPEKKGTEKDDGAEARENADSWLRDDAQARDTAGFGPLLEQAIDELSGSAGPRPAGRSGVLIFGNVHVDGDMLGGDKHASGDRRGYAGETVAGEVATTVLEQIERSFVAPPVYGRLRGLLRDRRIALLRAPSGWGRTTTALHLLSRTCAGGVQKLNPDTDLRKLAADKNLKPGCGHLLEIRAVDQLAGVKVPHLEELSAACAAHDVWLVVTVDEDIRIDNEVQADFALSGGSRPDLGAVLRQHLRVRIEDIGIADEEASAEEILADAGVKEILATFVNDTLSMRRIAELAERLSAGFQLSAGYAAVGTYFEELSETNFSHWFDESRDAARLTFIIALATLNGMSYVEVSRAARDLEERIRAVEKEPESSRTVFGSGRARRIEDARATPTMTTGNTRYGPVRVEGVRFHNDTYPRRVLERVWREYDDARPIVLEWLGALGGDRAREVRVRAAAAAGLLATFDFDRIHREILIPWADSDSDRERESAVSALRLPVTQSPELAVHVIRMMRDWSGPHSPRNRRLTASRALGASIGRAIRPEALRLLRRMALTDDLTIPFAVADSVMELFLTRDDNAQADVLAALSRWTSDTAPAKRRSTGVLCFLRLALYVSAEDPVDHTLWPGLLWFATYQENGLDRLGRLWRRALEAPSRLTMAQSVLAQWVTGADGERPMLEALGELVRHTVRDGYDAARLREAVEQSVTDHGETDATRSLLTTITELEKRL